MNLSHKAAVLGLGKYIYESKMKKASTAAGMGAIAGGTGVAGYHGAKKLHGAYKKAKDSGQIDEFKTKVSSALKKTFKRGKDALSDES